MPQTQLFPIIREGYRKAVYRIYFLIMIMGEKFPVSTYYQPYFIILIPCFKNDTTSLPVVAAGTLAQIAQISNIYLSVQFCKM